MKGKTHDLNHELTFSAHTINCVCHSIRLMFRVLGIFNFADQLNFQTDQALTGEHITHLHTSHIVTFETDITDT